MFNILCRTLSRLNLQTSEQINLKFNERLFKSEKKSFSSEPLLLFQTYTLIEEGKVFQEVPMIVQKINKIGNFLDQKINQETGNKLENLNKFSENNDESNIVIAKGLPYSLNIENFDKNIINRIDINTEEGTAILFTSDLEFLKNTEIEQVLNNLDPHSNSCSNYSYIENAISNEINCRVALQVRENDINAENIVALFRIVHYFQDSRNLLLTILVNRLQLIFSKLSATQMADILDVFHYNNFTRVNLFDVVKNTTSQWIVNYSTISKEKELTDIVDSLASVNYVDEIIIHGLEKYIHVNGTNIKDPKFVSALMKYCVKVRYANPTIMEFGAKYLHSQGKILPVKFLSPIFATFGYFPSTTTKNCESVFEDMTEILRTKFSNLDLRSSVEILLSYIYAAKYPQHLILLLDKKFQGKIRRALKTKKNRSIILLIKKIQTIDSVMALETKQQKQYGQRKNREKLTTTAAALIKDLRIRQMVKKIHQQLTSHIGGMERCGIELILADFPLIDIYNIDILIFPNVIRLPIVEVNMNTIKNCKAILINLPEHYCFGGKELIGPQLLRIRVLRKLGFQVATLNYDILSRMDKNSVEFKNYLTKQIDSAM